MIDSQINLQKGSILVVDDTPVSLRILVKILGDRGYSVRRAKDGSQAISIAREVPLDLILLDIYMPQMDGYEICEKLKADTLTRSIPIIFISALDDVLDKMKAFAVGGVDYITKPFQVEEVLARVETHLALLHLQKSLLDQNEELAKKNQELAKTLQQLKTTQEELIQSAKMAALGQLIAGVAHEVNTPLGAIRSSVENIADFLKQNLLELPQFFQTLSKEYQPYFMALLQKSTQHNVSITSKEKRQLKKDVQRQLEFHAIENAESIASNLINIGVWDEIEFFLPFLKEPDSDNILKTAYLFASVQRSTRTIITATDRAAKVVFALKSYARYDQSGEKVQANIIDGIETVLTLYHNQLQQGVELLRNYQACLPSILCYPDELNQVWTNLVHNALQAMDYKGTLTIDVKQLEENIQVSITDSGKGILPEIMPKIFEPFFTTKPQGEGSGLGLDIVRKIIDKHDGKIEVESQPGQTTFTVLLPIDTEKLKSSYV